MKKCTIILLLSSSSLAFADAPPTEPIKSIKHQTKIITIKPTIKNEAQEINLISQGNIPSVLLPLAMRDDIKLTAQWISTSENSEQLSHMPESGDSNLISQNQTNYNKYKQLVFKAKDTEGNEYDNDILVPINGHFLKVVNINTNLSQVKENYLNLTQIYEPKIIKDTCKAIFVQYQLKGHNSSRVDRFYINNNGLLTNVFPAGCKLKPVDAQDVTQYNNDDTITNISWKRPLDYDNKNFEFNLNAVNSGRDVFNNNMRSYIVEQNFTNIYFPEQLPNKNGPYLGTQFSHPPIPKGMYNVLIQYKDKKDNDQLLKVARPIY